MTWVWLVIGIVGGGLWLTLFVQPAQCVPVTEATEDFCNRLWTPPLVAMLVGGIGLARVLAPLVTRTGRRGLAGIVIGFALMAFGNGLEYWVFYDQPHSGVGGLTRSVLWMSVLAGWFGVLIGSFVVGVDLGESSTLARVAGLPFLAALPLTFLLIPLLGPSAAGLPLGLVLIAGSAVALVIRAQMANR